MIFIKKGLLPVEFTGMRVMASELVPEVEHRRRVKRWKRCYGLKPDKVKILTWQARMVYRIGDVLFTHPKNLAWFTVLKRG